LKTTQPRTRAESIRPPPTKPKSFLAGLIKAKVNRPLVSLIHKNQSVQSLTELCRATIPAKTLESFGKTTSYEPIDEIRIIRRKELVDKQKNIDRRMLCKKMEHMVSRDKILGTCTEGRSEGKWKNCVHVIDDWKFDEGRKRNEGWVLSDFWDGCYVYENPFSEDEKGWEDQVPVHTSPPLSAEQLSEEEAAILNEQERAECHKSKKSEKSEKSEQGQKHGPNKKPKKPKTPWTPPEMSSYYGKHQKYDHKLSTHKCFEGCPQWVAPSDFAKDAQLFTLTDKEVEEAQITSALYDC
jgi:hypothetical protein